MTSLPSGPKKVWAYELMLFGWEVQYYKWLVFGEVKFMESFVFPHNHRGSHEVLHVANQIFPTTFEGITAPPPPRWRWLGDAGLAQRRRSSHSLRPADPALSSPSRAPFKVLRDPDESRVPPHPAQQTRVKLKAAEKGFRSHSTLGETPLGSYFCP